MKANRPADVARLVSDRRAELGQTQQQVAERAGVTRQLIARLENGTGDPAVSSLLRVLDALDIELHSRVRETSSSDIGSGVLRLKFPVPSLDVSKIMSSLPRTDRGKLIGDSPAYDVLNLEDEGRS